MTRSGMLHSGMTKYTERQTDGSDYKGILCALCFININNVISTA